MLTGNFLLLAPPAIDADAATWAATVTVTAGRLRQVSNTIQSLKGASIWPLLDRFWILGGENSLQGRTCLKSLAVASPMNGPTFTANRGFTGDGLSAYLNTGFNPTTATAPNYVRDNAGFGLWEVAADTGGSSSPMGSNNDKNRLVSSAPGTSHSFEINSATATNGAVAHTATGHFHAQRTGATAAALFRNGVSFNTSGETSAAVVNCSFHVLSSPTGTGSGTPGALSGAQIGAAWIGGSLAGKEAAFYAIMRAHMTAIGVP